MGAQVYLAVATIIIGLFMHQREIDQILLKMSRIGATFYAGDPGPPVDRAVDTWMMNVRGTSSAVQISRVAL
jgi:hypothetical protein